MSVSPSREDELMLLAATATAHDAARAWAEFRVSTELGRDLDAVDGEQARLLPLLWRNLTAAGGDDPDLTRMKGAWRRAWSHNQLLFNDLGGALKVLGDRGIPSVLLKGAALVALGWYDAGARPMEDADVLVPADRFDEAARALGESGWERPPVPQMLEPAAHLINDAGRTLDLHSVIADGFALRVRPHMSMVGPWARAVPIDVSGHLTLTLCPSDLLLHVCIHGLQADGHGRLRWIADAITVTRHGVVDWDLLAEEAARRRAAIRVEAALRYLHLRMGIAIPESVLVRLAGAPLTWRDRLIDQSWTEPPPASRGARVLRRYARITAYETWPVAAYTFPGYMKQVWGIEGWRDVGRRLVRRLTGSWRRPHDTRHTGLGDD